MKRLTNPELKVIRFASDDVIATSLFYAPAAAYNAMNDTNFNTNYVEFNASMGSYDPDQQAWLITNIGPADNSNGELDDDIDFAPTIIGWGYAPDFFNSTYDAYEYNGNFYTKGVSYIEKYSQ